MGEKVLVKNDATEHVFEGGIVTGLGMAIEILKEANSTLPGMGLAKALIEARLGERRAPYLLSNLKAVSKAGHSIENIKSVYGLSETELEVEFYDLSDLAEQKPA